MFLIFALLGVIFVGAGVISLFAYNWSMFSREMKALNLIPSPFWAFRDSFTGTIRTQASDCMDQIPYPGSWHCVFIRSGSDLPGVPDRPQPHSMLLTGFLVMLPVVYLLDGYYLAILYSGGHMLGRRGNSDYTLFVLLLVPYYINRVKQGETCWQLSLVSFSGSFIWPSCTCQAAPFMHVSLCCLSI